VDKDMSKNTLYVAQGQDHPGLYHSHLIANNLNLLIDPQQLPTKITAKIRYRQQDQSGQIIAYDGNNLTLKFDTPQKAITMGQSCVIYHDQQCLGGGTIIKRF
jgi:tRNA-specific 2-thiouridylase